MSSTAFKYVFCVTILLLPALCAAEETVAILPVSYQKTSEAGKAEECPRCVEQVTERAVAAVKDAGFVPLSPEQTITALKDAGKDSLLPCEEASCIAEIRETLDAAEVVFIMVEDQAASEDEVEGIISVEVTLGAREGFSLENDAFYILLEELKGKTSVALLKEPSVSTDTSAAENNEEGENTSSNETEPGRTKLSPTPFWISLSVTGALIVGTIITDIVVYSRFNSIEDEAPGERSGSEIDSLRSLQVFDRVLMGVAAVGVITTAVLFLLTDFDKEKKEDEEVSLTLGPSPLLDGGSVSLSWRF